MPRLHDLGLPHLLGMLRVGELTPSTLVDHFLDRIERLDPQIGAFTTVTAEAARERAAADLPDGELHGIPFADKDLTARAGVPTRYGSRAFADVVPEVSDPFAAAPDATCAVSLGKTSTPEFGLTGYTESAVAAPTRNPWDLATGSGGSSGGAAAAVAAGLLPWAAASDGGGSIRIPSATCGVVGLKPSRGRLPIGSGLDSPDGLSVSGAITSSVEDAGYMLDVLTNLAPYPYAVEAPARRSAEAVVNGDREPLMTFREAANHPAAFARVGVTLATPWDDDLEITLDPAAAAAIRWAADALAVPTIGVDDIDWHPVGYPDLFRTLWRASAARLPLSDARLDDVEPITAWLTREGRALPADRLLGALGAARTFERDTIATFAPYDAILTPALAQSPRPIGWYDRESAETNFAQQVQYAPHTSWVNVAGLPAITVPVLADETGRPWSVQLVGRPGGETMLLALAASLEDARGDLPRPPAWFA